MVHFLSVKTGYGGVISVHADSIHSSIWKISSWMGNVSYRSVRKEENFSRVLKHARGNFLCKMEKAEVPDDKWCKENSKKRKNHTAKFLSQKLDRILQGALPQFQWFKKVHAIPMVFTVRME